MLYINMKTKEVVVATVKYDYITIVAALSILVITKEKVMMCL